MGKGSSAGVLPPANALSVCLVLEALGRAGEWEACLRLLQGAKESLPAMDKAGLAMVYKTAIGGSGRRLSCHGAACSSMCMLTYDRSTA